MAFGLGALSGIGSIGAGLAGLFGGHKNKPFDRANQYLNQIPGQVGSYYRPYQEAGAGALGKLQGQYGEMTDNPGDLYNRLSSGYTQSPGYKMRLQEALNASSNAAQAGGMAGTPYHQRLAMEKAEGIAGEDFEKYLNHILGLYGQGQQGLQGLESQGYNANQNMAQTIQDVLSQQAQYGYGAETQNNINRNNAWSNIISGLGLLPGGSSDRFAGSNANGWGY